jgi:protein-S-isoprenylcysteine O-methyltransferase Ste14
MDRRLIGWLLVILQFVLLIVLVLLPRREPTLLSMAIGVPILAAGLVLGLQAMRRLGPALTPTPVPISDAGLRTTGPYRYVRHPIYTSILLMGLGYVIVAGTWASVAGLAALLLLFWGKSSWEDRLLHAEYGTAWEEWAGRTGALVPSWHRHSD